LAFVLAKQQARGERREQLPPAGRSAAAACASAPPPRNATEGARPTLHLSFSSDVILIPDTATRLVWAGRQDWQAQSPARTSERDGFARMSRARAGMGLVDGQTLLGGRRKRADTRAGRGVEACRIEWNGNAWH
jgi:hypothetical protein